MKAMSQNLELHRPVLATVAPGLPEAGGAGSCGSTDSESHRDGMRGDGVWSRG